MKKIIDWFRRKPKVTDIPLEIREVKSRVQVTVTVYDEEDKGLITPLAKDLLVGVYHDPSLKERVSESFTSWAQLNPVLNMLWSRRPSEQYEDIPAIIILNKIPA